jgi:hypothetical protein
MGHKLVIQDNGKFAIFSTVLDDFIVMHATAEEIVTFYVEAAEATTRERVGEWLANPKRHTTVDAVIKTIEIVHGIRKARDRWLELNDPTKSDTDTMDLQKAIGIIRKEMGNAVVVDVQGADWTVKYPETSAEEILGWLRITPKDPNTGYSVAQRDFAKRALMESFKPC